MNVQLFLDFCFDFFYNLYNIAFDVYTFLVTPFGIMLQDFIDMIGLPIDVQSLLEPIGLNDVSFISFMFGAGLVIFLSIVLVKWFIDILP